MAPPAALRATPQGAALAAWQSQFRGALADVDAEGASDDDGTGEGGERARFRAVFISDLHLGTAGCQARPLLDFLKHHPSHTLYLVGDIIDGWQLRRKWYWPQAHNDVIQKLLRRSRKGCRVVFVPGNHDEFARQFDGHNFGGIEVANEAVHTTADGRRLWVVHGDYFDGVIQCAKWLAYLGDNAYEFTLKLNRHLNSLRARMGLPYWSLSQYLKHKVKSALNYVTDFERAVAAEARQRGYQGVVCGHIHRPEMRTIDGTLYCNDGDWVESLSALVEHMDGRLELVHWSPQTAVPVGAQGDKHEDPDRDGRLATAGEFGRHHTG
ncbi:MAG: UDP-2,3-diacylglucosamine diphosphatase [Hydrogenophaga sp.]|uniref:UDP-2,3-diacylglucosamine diphosphatase n=2 Tax=Hydrogenophaga sp. TaxID=1904254 RepID=UPI0027255369|nr:UDP-2,3-diacylglucosamine diphosphatase [Hydrogenophaga sp.]MDO9505039.1 UDP-2,3-diacylglucosamine diphosphatase [Hydrogenophaga sp.]MDP3626913.1 UDP-2,3-diacylglucosamine diphosphatase [Hydrogenophaga sp.]